MTDRAPAIAILPEPAPPALVAAVRRGGGRHQPDGTADGLVWLGEDPGALGAALGRIPSVRWIQLAVAGVEAYLPQMNDGRVWTCARGVYGVPVAEHALMLALAGLRGAATSVRSGLWSPRQPVSLAGADVVIVGGGSVGTALVSLLRPFGARVTVVRHRPRPMPGTVAVLPVALLDAVLGQALVVVLAAPLTAATAGLINYERLRLMRRDACLVNVARGGLVVTDHLVRAFSTGRIAAAGLDVTDPEPLPANHPLWNIPGCLITAHCAGTLAGCLAEFAGLVEHNVRRRARGARLRGLVDLALGY